jgi:hypothetical protein
MARTMLAMEMIPAIRRLLEEPKAAGGAVESGRRAALWRAQQQAAIVTHTVEDLRRYCLDSLRPRPYLDQEDYLRGYRQGFQAVLREIRLIETRAIHEPPGRPRRGREHPGEGEARRGAA